jgi:hypothetical protein
MRTYPLFREDGSLFAFEITSTWISFHRLFRTLRSVAGVTNLRRNYFNEDRASFMYCGERWIVNEQFGDNSRYWVGPERGVHSSLDATAVHEAFQRLESFLTWLWRCLRRPAGT